jgi:D-glycero-D-manno-heptose 1,7-bisphosphate phosphatase
VISLAYLDLDGTLISLLEGDHQSARTINEVNIFSGSKNLVALLKEKGYLPVLVTNQPDVARGLVEIRELERAHSYLMENIGLVHRYACYHDDSDDCPCRKPRPGMLLEAAQDFGANLQNCLLIGDSWRDIEAANTLDIFSIYINGSSYETLPDRCKPSLSKLSLDQLLRDKEEIPNVIRP